MNVRYEVGILIAKLLENNGKILGMILAPLVLLGLLQPEMQETIMLWVVRLTPIITIIISALTAKKDRTGYEAYLLNLPNKDAA